MNIKSNSGGNTAVYQPTSRVYQSSFTTDQPPVVLNQLSSKIHQPVLDMHQAGVCQSSAESRQSYTGSSQCSFISSEPGSKTEWNQPGDEFFEHDELDCLFEHDELDCLFEHDELDCLFEHDEL